jgi:hypothetical protein
VHLRTLDLTALPAGAFGDIEQDAQVSQLAGPAQKP